MWQVGVFLLLTLPLALIASKVPRAPEWNIALLWIVPLLMVPLWISALFYDPPSTDSSRDGLAPVYHMIFVALLWTLQTPSLMWATIWTVYFRRSIRVRNTFPPPEGRRRGGAGSPRRRERASPRATQSESTLIDPTTP